jgi:peptide/nickel transport system permease protein
VRRLVAVRLLHAVVVLFVVATIAFLLIKLAPGDPFSYESFNVPEEVRARMRAQAGYDRPLIEQYTRFLGNAVRGDLGYSQLMRVPVTQAIASRLPNTLLLMSLALTLSFAIGILLGVFEVRHRDAGIGRATNRVTLLVYSFPDFWLALMMLLLFAYWIPVLPAGGMVDPVMHPYMGTGEALVDRLKHLVLPLTTLTLLLSAYIVRYQRAALLEVLPADYVRTARAKGVPEGSVIGRHAFRNALLPMITLAGIAFPLLLGGSVFVERVFAWPGMGMLVYTAIAVRDYPLLMACVVLAAAMVTVGNLLADLAYAWADPRIRAR